jgi:hypothetical protein
MKPKKEKEAKIKNVLVYEEDGWFVSYTGTHGKTNRMKLDAETLSDAKFEAASLLDIPQDQVEN